MSAVAPRVFLVVVDETEEMDNALRYACRRAQRTNGHVALLQVIEPTEFQDWLGVGRVLESEARAQAELRLQTLAANVLAQTGTMPILYIREGNRAEQLVALLQEDQSISLVVLATATGSSPASHGLPESLIEEANASGTSYQYVSSAGPPRGSS